MASRPVDDPRIAALEMRVRELEAARAHLAALLDSMNEEVYFTDTEKRYAYVNPAALRQFGHTRIEGVPLAEIVGKLEVLREDGTPRPLEEAPPLRALAGEIVRDEAQIVRIPRTGELRHRQVSSAPVRNAAGEIIGAVSVVRDVTDLKRINAELQSADQRKDEFIAMLAHELRNPLVPIRAGVEMLKQAAAAPDLLDEIRPMMERQLGHMVRLIDDLLDVSRITSGKIELKRQPVTVSALVASAVEANREAIAEGRLRLSLELSEPNRVVSVDPTRFTQIISNLVQNATKFTPIGGRIAVSARFEGEGDALLVLDVTDTGIGMSAEALPHVFDLFAQDRAASPADRAGLGIGLALARRLVEMHGGTIDAHSDGAGRGSAFTIRLPIMKADAARGRAAVRRPAETLDGLRVLVVDDSRAAADSMAMLVRSLGAEARAVYDGASALAAVAESAPAIVLLDIGMPRMDGYEVCRRIRLDHGSRIALVALSGWGQEKDKRLALEAGFDLHLTKPADPAKLREAMQVLRRRAQR
jgi:PAS domain S-box-containing protein